MKTWRAVLAIVGGTFVEAIRNRLLLLSALFALVLVGLSVSAASVSIGEQSRLIVDVGLAAASALGSAIALALSVSSFAGELRRRTAYAVLARPVSRWVFVLGKYLGVVLAMALLVALMVLATAAVVWLYGDSVPAALWGSLWLTLVEMAVVVAVGTLFSTLATPMLAAAYAGGVVLAGNLAADLRDLALELAKKGEGGAPLVEWGYYLLPDLQKLSLRTQAANDLPVSLEYLALGSAYGAAYATAALVLAMWVFTRRRSV
ncbi:MAG: ABC transporter permease [Deltaproteobacteria bacterium]|nr:ABC transporter permease [Deltaproteobacteria bacterium]